MADAEKPKVNRKMQSRLQEQLERAKEQQRREMYQKRLEVVRKAFDDFRSHKLADATSGFHRYLKIMEEWKKVEENGLKPGKFDVKAEKDELQLLNGVYWDLVKLYDRTNSPNKYKEFKHYLNQYVIFSKGMPFEATAAETMRKYIETNKARRVAEFKEAYSKLGSLDGCFVATAVAELGDPLTVPRLQHFRDTRLKSGPVGRTFIRFYYRVGPLLAEQIKKLPLVQQKILAAVLDRAGRWLAPDRSAHQ